MYFRHHVVWVFTVAAVAWFGMSEAATRGVAGTEHGEMCAVARVSHEAHEVEEIIPADQSHRIPAAARPAGRAAAETKIRELIAHQQTGRFFHNGIQLGFLV